jgi:hypothetical protein
MAIAEFAGASETVLLRRLVTLCSRMSALSSQVTELGPIVDALAEGIGCGVAMVDRTLETLASAGIEDAAEQVTGQASFRTVLTAAARSRRPLAVPGPYGGAVVIAPVLVGEDVAGYLLTFNGTGDSAFTEDMRLLAIEHAAMVCGLVMGRDLVVTAAAGRAKRELVEALLLSSARDDPELDRWARHVGLDFSREHVVLVFDSPSARPGTGTVPVEPLLAAGAPGTVVTTRTDEIVAIVPVNGTAPAELAGVCLSAEQVTGAGIGNPCARAAGIARSYAEARRALEAGRRLGKAGNVSVFADVSDLREFAEEVLGDLGAEYLSTLAAYFRENGSPAKAAQSLGVHPNTVGYRIRRVEELAGLSFAVHRDRLMAEVAVEILEALGDSS